MAFDAFLKFSDTSLAGESTDAQHKGEIDVLSWSWGATQAIDSATGGATGKVSMQDFHFTTSVNKASPKLFENACSGKHIDSATLSVRKAGGDRQVDYIKITMSEVLVSSYMPAGAADADAPPSEEVSLNFAKIEFDYSPVNADGSIGSAITAIYDLAQAKIG